MIPPCGFHSFSSLRHADRLEEAPSSEWAVPAGQLVFRQTDNPESARRKPKRLSVHGKQDMASNHHRLRIRRPQMILRKYGRREMTRAANNAMAKTTTAVIGTETKGILAITRSLK
jgi:hypothetical protein